MNAAARRRRARLMDFDALVAAGWCECGQLLADHPPLPRPRRLASWASERDSLSIWARNRHLSMTEAQADYHRRQRGRTRRADHPFKTAIVPGRG